MCRPTAKLSRENGREVEEVEMEEWRVPADTCAESRCHTGVCVCR